MRAFLTVVLIAVSFIGSCGALLLPALRLTDSWTHVPLDRTPSQGFPVLVIKGEEPRIVMAGDPRNLPPLAVGETFLVPDGKERAFHEVINADAPVGRDSSWILRVDRLAPGRQRIELYLMGDGFSGGVYEATHTAVTPLYRKHTGPGFSWIFGTAALAMNVVLWSIAFGGLAVFRRWRSRRA